MRKLEPEGPWLLFIDSVDFKPLLSKAAGRAGMFLE